ncbi:MAG: thiol-disulfide oxidoreductase DCC family protein [Cyclobacteriaceae bacterium]|nr:thiol-disulfide oxidoreductase DCC family protein [Cyclobacteriaceae bacterium]
MSSGNNQPVDVVLFDGVCNLCSSSVQFIIKRDYRARYHFASLQSSAGQQLLQKFNLPADALYSIILVRGDAFLERSDAALEIARNLSGLWPLFYIFKIIPRFLRDPVYNWISRNRYRWFGKKDACWLPTAELKARFI